MPVATSPRLGPRSVRLLIVAPSVSVQKARFVTSTCSFMTPAQPCDLLASAGQHSICTTWKPLARDAVPKRALRTRCSVPHRTHSPARPTSPVLVAGLHQQPEVGEFGCRVVRPEASDQNQGPATRCRSGGVSPRSCHGSNTNRAAGRTRSGASSRLNSRAPRSRICASLAGGRTRRCSWRRIRSPVTRRYGPHWIAEATLRSWPQGLRIALN